RLRLLEAAVAVKWRDATVEDTVVDDVRAGAEDRAGAGDPGDLRGDQVGVGAAAGCDPGRALGPVANGLTKCGETDAVGANGLERGIAAVVAQRPLVASDAPQGEHRRGGDLLRDREGLGLGTSTG